VKFAKWQALSNDYLILEADELPFPLTPGRVRALCAAHTGIGADGVALLSRTDSGEISARLRIFNPDGSEAEVSGNGAREAALYLHRHGWADGEQFAIDTAAGLVRVTVTGQNTCSLALGKARTTSPDFPSGLDGGRGELNAGGRSWAFQHVQVGNPQVAIRVQDEHELRALDVAAVGPEIEHHELFPNRTNVSWFAPLARDCIRARIFERGVGETAASGTGATGAAVAHVLDGGGSPVTVLLDGGQLQVEVEANLEISLSGWAVPVFAGELAPEFEQELHGLA
jgi:diaminopimelate epimerase